MLVASAPGFVEDGANEPVVKIENLVGQSGACFEQDRDQSSITSWIVKAGDVLRGRSRSLAGELQQPVLMNELAKV